MDRMFIDTFKTNTFNTSYIMVCDAFVIIDNTEFHMSWI